MAVHADFPSYDATAHIAEEIENAAIRAPQAIASALSVTYVLGFLFNIVLAFSMGDLTDTLSSSIGQPVAFIFYDVCISVWSCS